MNTCFFLATFFLATTSPERAVWLCFGFYLLNVLVPIIPAVVIYRLFPQGKTSGTHRAVQADRRREVPQEPAAGSSVQGSVGGWKIKAVGAWGAYVTTFVLGYWAINATAVPLIKAVGGASVWTIASDFKLVDENGTEIEASVDKLEVEPPMVVPWGKQATIRVFSETLDPPEQFRMKLEGYGYQTIDLRRGVAENGKIKLPPIILKRLPPIAAGTPPPALPQGAGPAALTMNR